MNRNSQATKLFGKQSSLFSQIKLRLIKITLIKKDKIIKNDTKASIIISIFLNIQRLILFPMISVVLSLKKSVLKYKDRPGIKEIEKISKLTAYLNFPMWKMGILNKIVNQDAFIAC